MSSRIVWDPTWLKTWRKWLSLMAPGPWHVPEVCYWLDMCGRKWTLYTTVWIKVAVFKTFIVYLPYQGFMQENIEWWLVWSIDCELQLFQIYWGNIVATKLYFVFSYYACHVILIREHIDVCGGFHFISRFVCCVTANEVWLYTLNLHHWSVIPISFASGSIEDIIHMSLKLNNFIKIYV